MCASARSPPRTIELLEQLDGALERHERLARPAAREQHPAEAGERLRPVASGSSRAPRSSCEGPLVVALRLVEGAALERDAARAS